MKRLMLVLMLAGAVSTAFAQPVSLQNIEDIPNTYNTLNWSAYTLEELRAASRIVTPQNVCEDLKNEIPEESFNLCKQARNEKSAVKRAGLLLESAAIADNIKLAQYSVNQARRSLAENKVQEIVSQFK